MSHRSLLPCLSRCLCLVVAASFASVAIAADRDDPAALTEPPEDDPNYTLQGEFVGPISTGENQYQALGLQVRSIGNGRFEARQFAGGLPGQEQYEGGDAVSLIGRRSGDFLVLSGGPWALFVEKDHCLLLNRRGEQVGRLERIERRSPTLGAEPPEQAIVLFDGSGTDQFTRAEMSEGGLLKQGADFKPMVQDFDLHLEFRLPYMPSADGQARGNSGVYLQSRYECQVLDSFAQDIQINGCGALYRFKKPDVNMCLPPLVWQTYDIRFTAPRWAADGSKLRDARITAWLNGVKIHDDVAVPDKTGAGKSEAPTLLPTKLQDHTDPVRFRNVWMIDRGLNSTIEFPLEGDDSDSAGRSADTKDPNAAEQNESEKKPKQKNGGDGAKEKQRGENRPDDANDEAASQEEGRSQEKSDDQPKGNGGNNGENEPGQGEDERKSEERKANADDAD